MNPTDRDQARSEIATLLGSDGSIALAEQVLVILAEHGVGWRDALRVASAMSEYEWNAVLDEATTSLVALYSGI